jgi:putative PIG3 family NAD(P)H quinone oxidoreductase
MSFIEAPSAGGPEVLQLSSGPVPKPARGELLVRVVAAGVNRPDIQQRRGVYPPPVGASPVLGLEIAGEIVAQGEGVGTFAIGDMVCALTNGGGYAEYCTVPAGQCLPYPNNYDAIRAAALPETYFTVWANLVDLGRIASGETVLIHGGSSGIGVTAIKIARAFGATVFITAGSAEKCEACRRFGADVAINYRSSNFEEEIARLTSGRGVDVVLDMVGAEYTAANVRSLAPEGRLIIIGFMGGRIADGIDLPRIASRRLVVTGSTMRPRSAEDKGAIARALRNRIWPLLDNNQGGPEIHKVFSLADAAQAHRLMEDGSHIGKIVLQVAKS